MNLNFLLYSNNNYIRQAFPLPTFVFFVIFYIVYYVKPMGFFLILMLVFCVVQGGDKNVLDQFLNALLLESILLNKIHTLHYLILFLFYQNILIDFPLFFNFYIYHFMSFKNNIRTNIVILHIINTIFFIIYFTLLHF